MNKIKNMIIDCLYIGWFGGVVSWICGIFTPICETDKTVSEQERKEAREHYKKQMGYKS
jgi:hypothetical protein